MTLVVVVVAAAEVYECDEDACMAELNGMGVNVVVIRI